MLFLVPLAKWKFYQSYYIKWTSNALKTLRKSISKSFISSICFHQAYFVPWTWLKNEKKIARKKKFLFKRSWVTSSASHEKFCLIPKTNYMPDFHHMSYLNYWYQWNLDFPESLCPRVAILCRQAFIFMDILYQRLKVTHL